VTGRELLRASRDLRNLRIKTLCNGGGTSYHKKIGTRPTLIHNPNMRKSIYLAIIAALLLSPLTSSLAQTKFITDLRLRNGLRVLLLEDHSAPVVTIDVAYDVGSRNEIKGRTGFAHLFEHMMFKGSQNVGAGEHFYQVLRSGGQMNGFTTIDATTYWELLPANQLQMGLFLEADRMRSLAITKENLDNQRKAVQEERRQFVDNQAYGKAEEEQQLQLYDSFPYHRTVIGSMEDLDAANVDDVAAFFKTYYAPNNAVLTIVGDFAPREALALVKKYFENIPRQPAPPKLVVNEPTQNGERRRTLSDPLAKLAQVRIGYKTVDGNTADYYALDLLANILGGGQSSRLFQKVVKEKELVTGVNVGVREQRVASPFLITTLVRPGKKVEDVEAAIYDEIVRLANEPVADWELEKAKNLTRRTYVRTMQSALNRALILGSNTVFYNDPNLTYTVMKQYDAVTKADIQRVAKKYFQPGNRTVVITVPNRG
jgi:predicted Zn-dependent peptidase